MANFTYHQHKLNVMTGLYDPTATSALKVALMKDTYTPSASTHETWADVSGHEIAGLITASGYTAGGQTVQNLSASILGSNVRLTTLTPAEWTPSTITASGAVIYHVPTDYLVCFIDFGQNQSSSNGKFAIEWSTDGIVSLADA